MVAALAVGIDLPELFKNGVQVLRWDSRPLVAHGHLDVSFLALNPDLHLFRFAVAELERIPHQVLDDPADEFPVAPTPIRSPRSWQGSCTRRPPIKHYLPRLSAHPQAGLDLHAISARVRDARPA